MCIFQSSGNGIVGAIFLVTFITIGAFIFANLVVADLVANLVCFAVKVPSCTCSFQVLHEADVCYCIM